MYAVLTEGGGGGSFGTLVGAHWIEIRGLSICV